MQISLTIQRTYMSNILVTGASGQLGSEIEALSGNYHDSFTLTTREVLDITDKDAIQTLVEEKEINAIINCAAYTAVDKAETDEEMAEQINVQGAKNLAQIAKENNCKLIHVSTDYVFDGKHYKPYEESDTTNPNGVYGKTKRAGEEAIMRISPKDTIMIRTSWVYSSFGSNFVKTMLSLGKTKEKLTVINDQVGTPTYARDLAQAILDILPQLNNDKPEIYHYSNEGVLSWYDFAKEIMRMAKRDCQIEPIATKDYPTPATRPHMSLLNKAKIKEDFNIQVPFWKDSLDACLKEMGERK